MCEYLSFCVDLSGNEFRFAPDLRSHSQVYDTHRLVPDQWREAEWTGDNERSLTVRVHRDDPHGENWLRACILAKWPTRAALESWCAEHVPGCGESVACVTTLDGTRWWYRNGKLHREDGPALEGADGTREWWCNGELHREDGPAVERSDGTREWCRNSRRHREDGPAVERSDGTREWWCNGKLHREDGPAVERSDGTREWCRNGERHRDDGPAVEWADGMRWWYRNGKQIQEEAGR